MRDIKRIKRITALLTELWELNPDLRLMQLINTIQVPEGYDNTDPFFIEDDVWEESLQEQIDEIVKWRKEEKDNKHKNHCLFCGAPLPDGKAWFCDYCAQL